MTRHAARTLRSLLAAGALAACAGEPTPRAADTTVAAASAAAPADPCVGAAARDSVCFHRERDAALAPDGRPLHFTVDARGPAHDSLRVRLTIARGDTVLHRAEWSSAMYFRYVDRSAIPDSAVARRVRAHLAALLADSAFRPTMELMAGAADREQMLREAVRYDVATAIHRERAGLAPGDILPPEAHSVIRAEQAPEARVSALVAELRDRPSFRYYAGGEASYGLAWSAREGRLVTVFACC